MKKKYPINKATLVEALSRQRLSSYLIFPSCQHEEDAILPYDYMQHLSMSLFLPLHYLEVTLRNKVYEELVKHYRWRKKKYPELGVAEDWLEWMPTSKQIQRQVANAKRSLSGTQYKATDIISGLSFGAWVGILREHPQQNSHYHFWLFTHRKIFPNAHGETQESIYAELKDIRDIRNRLFHYEPIWSSGNVSDYRSAIREVLNKYRRIMKVIKWLSLDVFHLMKRRRNERELANQALFCYRIFKSDEKLSRIFNE